MTPMASRRQADKYWFSVEGETEKWYLEWLRDVVNADPRATRKVAFDVKHEGNFKRALGQLTIDDVVAAVARAKRIAEANEADGHRFAEHCTYRYCLDNPATDLWIAVEKVLKGAGIIGK